VKAEVKKAARSVSAKPSAKHGRVWRELVSWFWVVLAFVLFEGTVAQARMIPSGSMENTVLIGDHMIVSCAGYDAGVPFTRYHVSLWREPRRQQIIVLHAVIPDSPDLIKRVVGVPGDRIRIVHGQVYVNEAPLKEPYALHDSAALDAAVENYPPHDMDLLGGGVPPAWAEYVAKHAADGELVVPPDNFFVMGDNRDDSYDSRFWGFVPRSHVIGTPVIIYMSIDAPQELWASGRMGDRFRAYLDAAIHPGEVRWRRLLHTF
jgi:signal peptidase I